MSEPDPVVTSKRPHPHLVSVVVPVFNNATTLGDQLDALLAQKYADPYEVIVVDNGSSDDSKRVALGKAASHPNVRVIDEPARGANHARNAGSADAAGELIAYCDGDDVVSEEWIAALVDEAVGCDVVAGKLDYELLNTGVPVEWRSSLQGDKLQAALGFLPYGLSANLAVWKDALTDVGGWDENFIIGGTEVDLCWRLQLRSYRLGFAPDAIVHYRLRNSLSGLVRQGLHYGRGDVMLYRKYRNRGAKRNRLRHVVRVWFRLLLTSPDLVRSRELRGAWLFRTSCRAGRIWGSIKYRTLCP